MDLMQNNRNRQPEQFIDKESGIVRNKWSELTAEDVFAIKERMYHQSRRINETFDGKQWAAVFKANGLAEITKVNMELFQNQYNVLFDYGKMREFLKNTFDIDTPLPRHEKIEYPYEEHNEAFERANLLSSKGDGLDPESLGAQYDPNAPENQEEIDIAIAQAQKLLLETNMEQAAAEQRANRLRSDMEELDELIELDLQFEQACKEIGVVPHEYALFKYSERPGPEAIPFEAALQELRGVSKDVVAEHTNSVEKEAAIATGPKPGADEPASQEGPGVGPSLHAAGPSDGSPNDDEPAGNNNPAGGSTASPKSGNQAPPAANSPKESGINQYMEQIAKQEKSNQQNPEVGQKEKDRDKDQRNDQSRGTSINLGMPFVPRIGAITNGIVSYPTKKFREYRDTSVHKNNVVESRLNLLRTIKDVGENFENYTSEEKLSAAKRLNESVENYRDDIKGATSHAGQKNDRRLKDFLRDEKADHMDIVKKGMDKYLNKHDELKDLVKHLQSMIDMLKNILRSLSRAAFSSSPSGSSPSP
jgi:hypothetical protein